MRYFFWKGLLVVLLMQHLTSEGMPTPIQFPTEVTYQGGQSFPEEMELPVAQTVPLVSPPSLKDVQQAMQDASEQVKGRGAEEVLKELLERVVEAALAHVEAGGQAKDMAMEKKTLEEGPLVVEMEDGEAGVEAETPDLPLEERKVNGFEESEVVAGVDEFKNVSRGGKKVVKEEGETVAGSVEAVGFEVTDESLLETKLTQEDGASEETEGDLEAGREDSEEQVVLIFLKNATERETQDGKETPDTVEVAVGAQPEQETEEQSKAGHIVAGKEQAENSRRKEAVLHEKSQTTQTDLEKTLPHLNDHGLLIKPIIDDVIKEEGELKRGENGADKADIPVNGLAEMEQNQKTEAESTDLREATLEEKYGETLSEERSKALLVEEGYNTGEADMEDNTKDQEKRPENLLPTINPSLGGATQDSTIVGANSNHCSKTAITNSGILPENHGEIHPTVDHFVNTAFAEYHQTKGGNATGTINIMEDISRTKVNNEHSIQAWKIGAIFTAVVLVLEAVFFIIYVVKCRNKESPLAMQQAGVKGCVDPEAGMGGNCSEDTQSADNGKCLEMARLDPCGVATTLDRKREKQEDEHVVTVSNQLPSSGEMLPSPEPGQDFPTPI